MSDILHARRNAAVLELLASKDQEAPTFRHLGKEVLRDGKHYADAADEDAAVWIVLALNEYARLFER